MPGSVRSVLAAAFVSAGGALSIDLNNYAKPFSGFLFCGFFGFGGFFWGAVIALSTSFIAQTSSLEPAVLLRNGWFTAGVN